LESGLRNILHKFNGETKIAFRKRLLIYSFFLVLSVIFWFINALSKNYITTINYPVRYVDLPQSKILVGDAPDHLSLRITAHGYSILKHKLSSKYLPVNISLNSFSVKRSYEDDSSFYIPTRFAREELSAQLKYDIQVLEIQPDTLFFRFASIITKTLPVLVNINVEPQKQMIITGIPAAIPDQVVVTGPDYILDTLSAIYTESENIGVISRSTERYLELNKPEGVSLKNNKVKVTIGIEKFTEKTISVPIEIMNIPDSVKLITFPSNIEITCQVGLSNFPKIQPQMFKVLVDYKETTSGTGSLTVNLLKHPEFVRSVRYSPKKVEYLITK